FRLADRSGAAIEGRYVEVVPDRKVVFTWGGVEGLAPGESTVEITLEPARGGTLLKLRHYGLPPPAFEAHDMGWLHSALPKVKPGGGRRGPRGPRPGRSRRRASLKGASHAASHREGLMNWWITASGGLAAISAAGHALAGRTMFFRPIRARLADPVQAAVFTG